MTEDFKVQIIGDSERLEKAVTDASKLYKKLVTDTEKTQKELDRASKGATKYANAIENLNAELKAGTISQKKYEQQLERLQRAERNAQRDASRLENELEDLNQQTKALSNEFPNLDKGLSNTGKAAGNATPTLQEFSRVIQDAPFGIQGVGNNITQLVSNFGNLQKSAGGALNALKLIGSSFLGPAGILFAVSTAVSLLTVYGDQLLKSSSLTGDLAKATAEFVGEAQAEIGVLDNLLSIARDETLSKQTREQAIKRINDEYGDYLGNLNLERINTDEVKTSVDNLTRSLITQAQVRGAQALIEEKTTDAAEDLLELQFKQKDAYNALDQEVGRLISSVGAFNNVSRDQSLANQLREIQGIVNSFGGQGSGQLRLAATLLNDYNAASKATKDFTANFQQDLEPIQAILRDLTLEDLVLESQKAQAEVEVVVTAVIVTGKRLA